MTAPIILTELSSGAPTLNGVNGSLTAVLRWALVQASWAVEYGPSGNAAVFRPGSGNRHRLHVNHDSTVSGSAALATVRGCEGASAATTITDPFPTVAQVTNANATWMVSATAAATARRYKIFLWPTFFVMFIEFNSDGRWDPYFFGDLFGARPEDAYATAVACRQQSAFGNTTTARYGYNLTTNAYPPVLSLSLAKAFWCRDISGVTKSTKGSFAGSGAFVGQSSANAAAGIPALAGYGNRLEREKLALHCTGDNASAFGMMAQMRRGWFPNMWQGLHYSYVGVSSEDTFADAEYDAAASFIVLPNDGSQQIYMETTDTWSVPGG